MLTPNKKWRVYECPPIDYWFGWSPLTRLISDDEAEEGFLTVTAASAVSIAAAVCVQLTRRTHWQGDGEVMVSALPCCADCATPVYAVKQEDNGTTYILAPRDIPWLRECRIQEGAADADADRLDK